MGGCDRRRRKGKGHAAVAAWAGLARLRRPGDTAADGAAALDHPRLGAGRRQGPRRRSRQGSAREDRGALRRALAHARDAVVLHADGEGRSYRRLPLLPARPQAHAGCRCDLGENRSPSAVDRPPRDPLPHSGGVRGGCEAARCGVTRYGLVVLRRDRRLRRERPAGQCIVDLRLGAGLGSRSLPRRDRRPAAEGQPRRDAGALQPPQRACARSLPGGVHARAAERPEVDRHGAAARTGRACLRQGRKRPALRP